MEKIENEGGISGPESRPTPAMFSNALEQSVESTPASNLDDRRLIHETLNGSQAAFQSLIEKYQVRVFRLLQRFTKEPHETEDLAQDVFLKVFKRLHTFQFEAAFYTWLYRIAINTATDHVQRKKRSPVQAVDDPQVFEKGENSGDSQSPDRGLIDSELQGITKTVLSRMPEKYRVILELREYEELSYEEIGKILGCAMGTVESRLFRAREKFREILVVLFPEYAAEDSEEGENS